MTPLLILTAGFGEGHNAAARNLHAACELLHGPGSALTADLFALASPRLNAISRRGYIRIINSHPRVWSSFYSWVDRSHVFPRHLWFLRREMRLFAGLLAEHEPRCVCSVYPIYGFMADVLRKRGLLRAPFHNVVTDSISVNSLWTRPCCDRWHVPNSETREAVTLLGVPAERISDHGFPVQPYFSREGASLRPPDLRQPQTRPKVLHIINSGVQGALETAALLSRETNYELTFAVGRDENLYRRILAETVGRSHPTTLLKWTNRIPELLSSHHVVISKAGGATTQEAIAARCPMIVSQIVPGQEEGNYELLRRRKAGTLARDPQSILAALRHAFEGNGEQWHQWRAALEDLARPEAAFEIVRELLPEARVAEMVNA